MADLAYERVGTGGRGWIFILHGIFGSGRNWASVARRLVRERSDWGAVLVDLREHGDSKDLPPPHTIAAAAADVNRLSADFPGDRVLLGHSFGGKVALAAAQTADRPPCQVWVVDSTPERRAPEGSAWTMLQRIRALPDRFPSRASLVTALEAAGIAKPVAQWMATNLEAENGNYAWRFDLDAIEALLRDFFATDLWAVVESPPDGTVVHLVKAEDSSVLSGAALDRVERAAAGGRTLLHRVAGGHWVNADNPDALIALLAEQLP